MTSLREPDFWSDVIYLGPQKVWLVYSQHNGDHWATVVTHLATRIHRRHPVPDNPKLDRPEFHDLAVTSLRAGQDLYRPELRRRHLEAVQ